MRVTYNGARARTVLTSCVWVLLLWCLLQLIADLLHDMETKGVKPNEGCYTSIITAYCKVCKLDTLMG